MRGKAGAALVSWTQRTGTHHTHAVVFILISLLQTRYRFSFLASTPCTVANYIDHPNSGHIAVARTFVNLFFWSEDRPGCVVVNPGHTPFSRFLAANVLA